MFLLVQQYQDKVSLLWTMFLCDECVLYFVNVNNSFMACVLPAIGLICTCLISINTMQ